MKDELIKVIAEYLGSVMTYNNSLTKIQFERACVDGAAEFINKEAAEIAGKVLVVMEQKTGWEDAPEWANWLASNNKGFSQWFEDKPIWDDNLGFWDASTEDGRYKFAGKLAKIKELQQRPK